MPQACLPIFEEGEIPINHVLSYKKENGKIWYFNWAMPIGFHDEDDYETFKMYMAQFVEVGHVKQADVCRAFGIPKITMLRAADLYRKEGHRGFYKERTKRGPSVMTSEVIKEAQRRLDEGEESSIIANDMNIKLVTFKKAISDGRLRIPSKKKTII
jgi:transposase-like protein